MAFDLAHFHNNEYGSWYGVFTVPAEDSNFSAINASLGGPEECGGFQPWLWCYKTLGSSGGNNAAGLEKPAAPESSQSFLHWKQRWHLYRVPLLRRSRGI